MNYLTIQITASDGRVLRTVKIEEVCPGAVYPADMLGQAIVECLEENFNVIDLEGNK